MIRCEKLGKHAYKIDINGSGESIVDEYVSFTEYLLKSAPELIEEIQKEMDRRASNT